MSSPKQPKRAKLDHSQEALEEQVPKGFSKIVTEIFHKMNGDVLDDIPLGNGMVVSEMFVRILERLFDEENIDLERMKTIVFQEFEREAQMVKAGTALLVDKQDSSWQDPLKSTDDD
jgi:hypothetical protein